MSGQDKFAFHASAVARDLLGEPNKQLSIGDELRFGKQGSMSVDVKKGTFFDHESKEGGGVLWLIERETGQTIAGGHAVEWLRQNGYDVEDDRMPSPASERNAPRTDKAGNWLPQRVPDHGELTKAYDYRGEDGSLAYQVCRYDWSDPDNPKGHSKTFVQRRPDSSKRDGWTYKVRGLTALPYRLPELIKDVAEGRDVFVVEGEKKVDMMRAAGLAATCNHGGAGKFPDDLVQWFDGPRVIVIPDNDEEGRKPASLIGRRICDVAASVKILDLPDVPPKGSVDDWLPDHSAGDLVDLARGAKPFIYDEEPFTSRFGAVQWLDLDEPGPRYDYLVKGVLTENEMSFLLGESQSGKSFVAIDMAMAVARGTDWFGRKVHRGGVIYQAGESARGVRRRRFPAYRIAHDCGRDNLPVVMLEKPVDFYNSDEDVEAFIDECKHWARVFRSANDEDLKLIIIDTFNKATPGANENDGKDMGAVLARCDRVRRETGAHVMLVHHLNAGGTKARGHTSLFGNVENVVTVRRIPEQVDIENRKIREWVVSKAKDGEDGVGEKFVLRGVELGTDNDGDRITSCVVCVPEATAAKPDSPDGVILNGFNAVLLRAIYTAVSQKGVYAPKALGLAQGHLVIGRKELWDVIRTAVSVTADESPAGDGESNEDAEKRRAAATRQRVQRAREFLYQKGLIEQAETDDPKERWLWLTGKRARGFEPAPTIERGRGAQSDLPMADQPEVLFGVNPDDF